jgi:hypothetical protein
MPPEDVTHDEPPGALDVSSSVRKAATVRVPGNLT